MSTGMRKWMEKDCPDIPTTPAEVSIDREELRQLRDELDKYKAERDALRAKIERMEQQEPAGKFIRHPSNGLWEQDGYGDNPDARPLYALPGAKGDEK